MANKKKLIQSSKTLNILEDYSFVLFIQQPQKKYMPTINKLVTYVENGSAATHATHKKDIHIFRYKNTIIKKCISNFFNSSQGNSNDILQKNQIDFQNIFQGPNMLIAGNDLTKLPSLWKSLNTIPHLFFCGAIVDKTIYNHLDLEKAIECVYNTSSQDVYNRLIMTLIQSTQITELSREFEYKISNILSGFFEKNASKNEKEI